MLRIIVLRPVDGVALAVQRKDRTLLPASGKGLRSVWFDFPVRLGAADGPDFLGPFVHGPRGGRFVYVNVGAMAGQAGSPWQRRAKVPLAGITSALAREVTAGSGLLLAAAIAGTGKDGTPACATVPLASDWRLVRAERGGRGRRVS
jgi:hypothetical protein